MASPTDIQKVRIYYKKPQYESKSRLLSFNTKSCRF